MSLISNSVNKLQDAPFPDFLTRPAIALLVANARKSLKTPPADAEAVFAREMAERPVAEYTDAANQQHYELPARFFELCLGSHRKYSSCLYETPMATLDQAEATPLPADWDDVHTWPPADQAEAFEAEGWDVTDKKRKPLRLLPILSLPLWLAVRGVAGTLPFHAEPDVKETDWGSGLAADAARFRKR